MADTPTPSPDWYYIVGSAQNCPICKTTETHFQAVSKEILVTHKIPTVRIEALDYKNPLADLAKWPKDVLTYIPPGFPFVLLVKGTVWDAAMAQLTSITGPSEPVKLRAFMLDWKVDEKNQLLPNHQGYARTKAGMLLWIALCIGSGTPSDKIAAKPMVPTAAVATVVGTAGGTASRPTTVGPRAGVTSSGTAKAAPTCGTMEIHPKRRR